MCRWSKLGITSVSYTHLNQLAFLPGETVGLRANWKYEDNSAVADLGKQALGETDPDVRADLLVQIQEAIKDLSLIHISRNRRSPQR